QYDWRNPRITNAADAKTFGPRYIIKVSSSHQSSKMQRGPTATVGHNCEIMRYQDLQWLGAGGRSSRIERVDVDEIVTLRCKARGHPGGTGPGRRGGRAGESGSGQERRPAIRVGLCPLP